ncbi:MAG: hypothetical protein EBS06_08975 [Proteobacteria bacterium]|nr:hypothetical protein [Pseudomonadota bacterium]
MIIKKFKHFIKQLQLNEELEPETTDQKIEKEESRDELKDLEKQLSDYNSLKSKIEQLYSSTKNDAEISQEIEKLMPEKEGRNKFAVDWMKICRLENEIKELIKTREDKKNKKSELLDRKELNKNEPVSLKNIETQLKQNSDDQSTITVTLAEKEKQIKQVLKEHDELMKKAKDELTELKKKV